MALGLAVQEVRQQEAPRRESPVASGTTGAREKRARRPPVAFVAGPASGRLQPAAPDRGPEEAGNTPTAAIAAPPSAASASPPPQRASVSGDRASTCDGAAVAARRSVRPASVSMQADMPRPEAGTSAARDRTADVGNAGGAAPEAANQGVDGSTPGRIKTEEAETDQKSALPLQSDTAQGAAPSRRVRRPPPVFLAGPASGSKKVLLQARPAPGAAQPARCRVQQLLCASTASACSEPTFLSAGAGKR